MPDKNVLHLRGIKLEMPADISRADWEALNTFVQIFKPSSVSAPEAVKGGK